jgi:hypothetical protein
VLAANGQIRVPPSEVGKTKEDADRKKRNSGRKNSRMELTVGKQRRKANTTKNLLVCEYLLQLPSA